MRLATSVDCDMETGADRDKTNEAPKQPVVAKPLGIIGMSGLGVVVGVVTGLGAVVFRELIAFFHNFFFLGRFSLAYNTNVHTQVGPWGIYIILVPAIGALGVVFLVKNFAPEAKGHGVSEVIDSIYFAGGNIRPIVAVIKSLASALSIGSGGSVGREGPMIQIGASFGSTLGQMLKTRTWQRITLIAAGGGGGIAAAFNTPVGGILFAIEILMHEISVRTLVPVAIATATATYVSRIFFGKNPSFAIPALEAHTLRITSLPEVGFYLGLGIFMGLVSAFYINVLYGAEDVIEGLIKNYYLRHVLGMLCIGILMYVMLARTGHYYIEGVGYATIQDILSGALEGGGFLLLLFALKLLATSVTIGSGASGGIFSPGMFLGASAGAAYGELLRHIFPGAGISVPAFAVAGMAAVIGGSTGAAVTAIVMIFEMTLDYSVILPITVSVAIADAVRRMISRETIYTRKIVRRGHPMPEALQTNFYQLRPARDLMDSRIEALPANLTLGQFANAVTGHTQVLRFLVERDRLVVGVITRDAALVALEERGGDVPIVAAADMAFVVISGKTTLLEIIATMERTGGTVALVGRKEGSFAIDNIEGVISKDILADAMIGAMHMFTD